jgi:Xaa-Pro aminopeptidase
MRVLKNSEELRLLRRAVNATVVAHAEAIRSAEPKMREYQLQAIVEYVFTRQGCEFTGYNSIVGSGPNSCILHYETNRREMKSGDLIVMDVGGEYHGYTADVTRTFPVNGKFTLPQRAIYDLVLRAQDAGIAACRSGAAFNAGHRAAMDVIQKGLVDLGVIASPDEASRYFMHGTSHYIGLDVHDAHGDNTLKPNYTLTVEPGIYIKEGSPCDPKWWNIGVRIEDDILVTEGDPINLSGALPRQATQIEALMRERGIGNAPLGKPGPKGKSAALR